MGFNELYDEMVRIRAELAAVKAERDRLREAIGTCVGIIRASGQVNTKLLADKLEQALKESEVSPLHCFITEKKQP